MPWWRRPGGVDLVAELVAELVPWCPGALVAELVAELVPGARCPVPGARRRRRAGARSPVPGGSKPGARQRESVNERCGARLGARRAVSALSR